VTQLLINVPILGNPNATEDVKVTNNFTNLAAWAAGQIDGTNLSALAAQSAGVNQAAQTVKGVSNIATSQVLTSTTYATMTTPDQVTGIVLPTNGLIAVWYRATWQESVAGAALAAVFLGSNQVQVPVQGSTTPNTQAAATNGSNAGVNYPLASSFAGLVSANLGSAYTGDVTTGQLMGIGNHTSVGLGIAYQDSPATLAQLLPLGGPMYIEAAAGTYTVSVRFRSTSGSVTVANRLLRAQAISFS
jgi:hypothetical protein